MAVRNQLYISVLRSFLGRLHIIKPTLATVEKKSLYLVLPYLGPISLQVKTKKRNAMKNTLNCCKLQVIFKSERKLSNIFRFKDRVPYNLVQEWFMNIRVVDAIILIMVRKRDI